MTATPGLNSAAIPAPGASASGGPAPDVVIHCAGLTKTFRDFWLRHRVRAVDGLDLEIHRGQVFGLLGPNGSGKSTTIKMILGLLHPTRGNVTVLGKRPDDVAIKQLIGYLPEESYLYRFLNARETLDYYGRLFYLPRPVRRRRIEELLEQVGLRHEQFRAIGEYSKGMQRKIGLAQALINDPALLVLDEPTSGMDPTATRDTKDLLLRLARRGKTILLCSHLLADAEELCDRVAMMYGGKIIRQGTIDQLLTIQDRTTLQTDSLDDQTIEQIDQMLTQRGRRLETVNHPRQTLEHWFIDRIREAQSRGAETSGALAGGRLADFLTGEEAAQADAAAVIAGLVRPAPGFVAPAQPEPAAESQSPQTPPKIPPELVPPPEVPPSSTVGRTSPSEPAAAAPQPPAPAPPADYSLIESLLAPAIGTSSPQAPSAAQAPAVTPPPDAPLASPPTHSPNRQNPGVAQSPKSGGRPIPAPPPFSPATPTHTAAALYDQSPTPEELSLIESLVNKGWGARETGGAAARASSASPPSAPPSPPQPPEAPLPPDSAVGRASRPPLIPVAPAAAGPETNTQAHKSGSATDKLPDPPAKPQDPTPGERPFTGFLDAVAQIEPSDPPDEPPDDPPNDAPRRSSQEPPAPKAS